MVMDYESDTIRTNRWARAGKSDSAMPTPDLFRPHPNLADSVNRNICLAEIAGGAKLDSLPAGTLLEIETQNRYYTIEYRGHGKGIICGHPRFCPQPTLVRISGSTWGGSMLWVGYIGRGMHLEFAHPIYGRITTSMISEIRVIDENHPPARRSGNSTFQPEFN
jgi:hypothetical protein